MPCFLGVHRSEGSILLQYVKMLKPLENKAFLYMDIMLRRHTESSFFEVEMSRNTTKTRYFCCQGATFTEIYRNLSNEIHLYNKPQFVQQMTLKRYTYVPKMIVSFCARCIRHEKRGILGVNCAYCTWINGNYQTI